MRDERRPPFCYQTLDATAALRARFEGKERTTALAVYQTLTETAQACWRDGGRDGFRASRTEIAGAAGVSEPTVDKYAKALVELGLLRIERERAGAMNLPNVWSLTDLGGGQMDLPVGKPVTQGWANEQGTSSSEERTEVLGTGNADGSAPARELAAEIIRYFAVKSGGLEWTGAKMVEMIEERIAEHPELSIEDHRRIMDAAFEQPWWSEQNPSPFVVYGKPTIFGTRIAKAAPREHPVDRRIRELEERKQQLRAEGR